MQDDLSDTGLTKKINVRVDEITPEMAAKWLERNHSNRNIQERIIDRYARDMSHGNWLLTGEAIQFGSSGRLLNGQHRLLACIRSGTAFRCVVVRNIADEEAVVDAIDTGAKRTLGHALQIHGEPDANQLAAIVNMCWRYETHRLSGTNIWPTHAEALLWLAENPQVRAAQSISRTVYREVKIPRSASGAAFYLNSKVDSEASLAFWERVASGEDLETEDVILAYRRWMFGTIAKRERPTPDVHLAYALKAMNLWRERRKVRILVHKPNEDMPEVWA